MNGKNNSSEIVENWKKILREQGCRITLPREAVVEVLASSQRALDASQVFDLAIKLCPSLGLVSVYRTLEILEEHQLIQRVHQPNGCHAYIAGFKGHQHMLICTVCGKTVFFDGEDLDALFKRVAQDSGYKVTEHWLQLFGLCEDCKR